MEELKMVNTNQIKRGLANFVDAEIINKIPGGTIKKTLLGAAAGLYISNMDKTISNITKNPFIAALGVVNEAGEVDIDTLTDALKKNISDVGVHVDLDIAGIHLGDMTLHRSDIDVLRTHILSA
jgi:hypothetical protein